MNRIALDLAAGPTPRGMDVSVSNGFTPLGPSSAVAIRRRYPAFGAHMTNAELNLLNDLLRKQNDENLSRAERLELIELAAKRAAELETQQKQGQVKPSQGEGSGV